MPHFGAAASGSGPAGVSLDGASGSRAGNRAALASFVALEAGALPLILWWGRHGWFSQDDDWDFLTSRTAGNFGDLMRPHFQHWTTLPILAYRLIWALFGIRHYLWYLALAVLAHLAVAALLRAVMRRAGVSPWPATIAAAIFVLFGSGAENVLIAFQVTFVGAMAFGLSQLLLADHHGPLDRRDWLGLLAGFAGLLCSGIALTMTVVVGLAVLSRRGWRLAMFHTVPLASIYLIWAVSAPKGQSAAIYRTTSPVEVAKFVVIGVSAAFGRIGQLPGLGFVVGAVLVVGLVLTFAPPSGRATLRGRAAAPIALLAGAAVFLVVTGIFRAGQGGGLVFFRGLGQNGPDRARLGRYVYIVAAMALPAIALAAQAVIRKWRQATSVVVALAAIALAGNVAQFVKHSRRSPQVQRSRYVVLDAPRLPLAAALPRSLEVAKDLTMGWLIDNFRAGRIPDPGPRPPGEIATETLDLALKRADNLAPDVRTKHCRTLDGPTVVVMRANDTLTVKAGIVRILYAPPDGGRSVPRQLPPNFLARSVIALAGPLRLILVPLPGTDPRAIVVCGPTQSASARRG
jgi:hypothetical protein